GQARIETAWLRAWVSTPMTNGRACATIAMAIDAPLLRRTWSRSLNGRRRSGKRALRGESVMVHDPRVGQSASAVTEVARTAPAAPHRADNSTRRHRKLRANCFESHTRFDTTGIHPDQPIPDQPEPDSQIASVGPLLVPGRLKNTSTSVARSVRVRPSS